MADLSIEYLDDLPSGRYVTAQELVDKAEELWEEAGYGNRAVANWLVAAAEALVRKGEACDFGHFSRPPWDTPEAERSEFQSCAEPDSDLVATLMRERDKNKVLFAEAAKRLEKVLANIELAAAGHDRLADENPARSTLNKDRIKAEALRRFAEVFLSDVDALAKRLEEAAR